MSDEPKQHPHLPPGTNGAPALPAKNRKLLPVDSAQSESARVLWELSLRTNASLLSMGSTAFSSADS